MEKIQIQFKESDYKIYYNYCERYYQIHDAVRKRSIQAFLDLFESGILPVDEQDIRRARLILSQRCGDLKKKEDNSRGEDDQTTLLQVRACSDILIFCDDLEKIYRLLQKQGMVKNYLIILGTFSRVIDEAKNSDVSALFDLDDAEIAALADPLAEMVRERLGTDRQWRSVLRELSAVSARFNRVSAGPKFDLDILKIVSPAVVSRFNKDVQSHEIVSVLPSFFKDSELDEFEALLSRTPDVLPDESDMDSNWETISEPLKVIATKVAEQREQYSQNRAELSDQDSLALPSGIFSPGGDVSHALSPSYPGMPQPSGQRVFDIEVSPDGTTHVDSPIKVYPAPEKAAPVAKSGFPSYMPLIIGVSVILLFIIGTLVVTGNWHFMGAGDTTNSTSAALKNTSSQKNTTATVTKTPTTKPVTSKTTAAVQKTTTQAPAATATQQTAYSSTDIGNHLIEVSFGPDYSVIKKPTKDLVSISVSGSNTQDDIDLVQNFISQFNNLSSTTKIASNIELVGKGDIQLVFLPGTSLNQINTDNNATFYKDVNTGSIYFLRTNEQNNDKTYIDSDLDGSERDRWILRAMLANLGFYGETAKYPDSVFYSGDNDVSKLSYIDLKAIQLMYGQKIKNGMTRAVVKTFIQ
jgi:hypothetical protein